MDLNFEFLASSAQQGGIAKRRVRLDVPGQLRAAIDNVKEKAAATAAAAAGPAAVVGGGLGGGAGAAGGKQQQGTLFPPVGWGGCGAGGHGRVLLVVWTGCCGGVLCVLGVAYGCWLMRRFGRQVPQEQV